MNIEITDFELIKKPIISFVITILRYKNTVVKLNFLSASQQLLMIMIMQISSTC